jgi:hypothetical protein
VAVLVPAIVVASTQADAATFSSLTLQNGWTNAPFASRDAGATVANSIVTLKGAIATTGTDQTAFTLSAPFRPLTEVDVPVDLCDGDNGRLQINPNGTVVVQAEVAFSDAQCFTSLEGVSFAHSSTSFKALTLQNGWTNGPFSTSNAAARLTNGIVHLKGAISTFGSNAQPFVLPTEFRPASEVFVKVDMCNATNGRLQIDPSGTVTVEAEGGTFSNAACFTSLDGVSFATSATSFTPLTLQNGWTNAPFSTANAAAEDIDGIVHLEGAIASGTSNVAFTLPDAFRPPNNVWVPVDMCGATNGRLEIQPTGVVTVQTSTLSNAQCFTSLDGVSFADATFARIPLGNGWANYGNGNAEAAATTVSSVVTLKGAISTTGTSSNPFTLPSAYRPATEVYVPVDLCNGTNGRLDINPSGAVTVESEGVFSNATCFTSLDGVSFAKSATSYTPLTLQNGWTNAPFSTSDAAVRTIAGIVYLKGAIATTGTNPQPFVLPTAFRPATEVFVKVDLCSATDGRLQIDPSGTVTVEAEDGTFSNAQCLTSLDGVSFAKSATSFTPLTLQNGWTDGPDSTSNAAAEDIDGIVHLKGAITTTGTSFAPFTLPAAFRPTSIVDVPVDMCDATNGRLVIAISGAVEVQAESAFANAACFTSLDGVEFAP